MSAPLKKKEERRIFGVGLRDPTSKISETKAGVLLWMCPYYVLWVSMLRRCYSKTFLAKNPTYGDCRVVEEWHNFEAFKCWVKANHNRMGFLDGSLEFDKDLLGNGKLYSPETCVFIPKKINVLFNDRRGDGDLPLGVHKAPQLGAYKAQISNQGKREYLGSHKTPEDAHKSWQQRKVEILMLVRRDYLLSPYQDCRVSEAIKQCAKKIAADLETGKITHKTLRH